MLKSHVSWDSEHGQVLLPLRNASAAWDWSGENLKGTFDLDLANHGEFDGSWRLPLAARLPPVFDPDGQLQVTVDGTLQSTGILSAMGPWLMQDVRGETRMELAVQGTWESPDLRGRILLRDGSAYLPATGVQLENIQLQSELAGDRLRIDRVTLDSGPGELSGQGELIFNQWQLADFSLDITGNDFQLADFPELQVTISPELVLSGTPDRFSLQGTTLVPKLAITGSRVTPEVLPSKDVVIARAEDQRQELEVATDIEVTVELGDDVTVKSGGVDTRLTGGGVVSMGPTGELLARGEIQLVSGWFRSHGVNLKIRQGVLNYQDEVITNPDLRIFAAREVGDVLAGVQVTGNAEAPVVTLYSRPAMPERDILGYMLMGRAIDTENEEADMLMMGTGTLLGSYGGGLSELGITDIDIQGLFTGSGGLRLRRKISEKWEVQSTLGTESGVDLFYIIELE
jgi:translocation and assembly module TamB